MTNISQHIEQLLRRHDCVIVPTIGAFIVSYKSAYINDEWGIMTPPKREVHFNASIVNNDGLLANSIARKNRISFEAANLLLQQEIEKIRTQLERNKEYAIGRLGILHLGEEANIDFKAFKSDIQLNANYGLNQFRMKTLKEIQEAVYASASPSAKADNRSDKNYYIPINKRFAQYAAMFIVVFFAAISLSVPSGQYKQEYASVVPITQSHQTHTPVDTVIPTPASQVIEETPATVETQAKPQVVAEPTPAPQAPEATETASEPQCYAVVATMSSVAEAEKYIRTKSTDKQLQIVTIGKMSRVYTDCGSRQEMASIITNADFQAEFPGAWIWQPRK